MNNEEYRGDAVRTPMDAAVVAHSGPEPVFDRILEDFLCEGHRELRQRCGEEPQRLVEFCSLGRKVPWLYRFSLRTKGLVRVPQGEISDHYDWSFALRFLPDYLQTAQSFEMLALLEPRCPFHPNIAPGGQAVCLQIHPGESPLEILHSLHDLVRWRLRAYHDALNQEAAHYGRQHIAQPIDDRPLLGRPVNLQLAAPGENNA